MDEPSDEQLMQRIRSGDHDAYGALVRRHVDALYNYAYRLSHTGSEAEDLVQETLLTVWQKPEQFNPARARLTTWLHRIAHNRFIDQQRRRRPELDNAAAEQLATAEGIDRAWRNGDWAAQLQQLLTALPLNQRSAILLSHAQGFSNQQVAHIMGLSVRAVESLLSRARRNLRSAWQIDEQPDTVTDIVGNRVDAEAAAPPTADTSTRI